MEEYDSSMIMIFVWFISSQSANKLFMSFFMISFMSTENKNNTSNKIQTQTSGQKCNKHFQVDINEMGSFKRKLKKTEYLLSQTGSHFLSLISLTFVEKK